MIVADLNIMVEYSYKLSAKMSLKSQDLLTSVPIFDRINQIPLMLTKQCAQRSLRFHPLLIS